jgi:uncharacterized protein (TIGR02145 family)
MKSINVHRLQSKLKLIFSIFSIQCLLFSLYSYSQTAINTTGNSPDHSAMLDMSSTNSGFLINRMNTVQMNAIVTPAEGLLIFNVDNSCYEAYVNNAWYPVSCPTPCITPSAFTATAASPVNCNSFTANWNASTGATGYNLDVSTVNTFTTFLSGYNNLNVGNLTSFAISGLTTGTSYYYRLRAEPTCSSVVTSNTITAATLAVCGPSCGSQVWMSANMNTGTTIPGTNEQSNNSVVEKYCYQNLESNCDIYGALYEWAEAVQLPYSYNSTTYGTQSWMTCDACGSNGNQGVCPNGYHIPTFLEWNRYEYCVENNISPKGSTPLSDFQYGTGYHGDNTPGVGPGSKMKSAIAFGDGAWSTNTSGFTVLPAGYSNSGSFGMAASFWSATENSSSSSYNPGFNWNYAAVTGNITPKIYGLSVRCLKN